MSEHTQESTLGVLSFTPYSRTPDWISRSGDKLSHGAVRLYTVIMSYADNQAHTAFPGRDRLAEQLGVKPRTISAYIKELEEFGALIVERRRNKRTGNFYSNHYLLVFDQPGAIKRTRRSAGKNTPPGAKNVTLTKPTSLTTLTDETRLTHSASFVGGEPQALSKLGPDTFPQGYSQAEWEADIAEVGHWGS